MLSQDLPHHPSKGCPTSCSCSTKVPHHNAAPGAREAGRMAERRNHHPVEEPTDWVSSLAYSCKANGKLQICLDPKDLNAVIKRDHYKTPTVEEITHELAGSRKFTKLDGTSSYLCIILDYESSLLTTFNTLWGRYRFICLPFGLACSQDIFQRMMDQILERCEGVIGIADDIVVHGKDDEEHDRRLHNLM